MAYGSDTREFKLTVTEIDDYSIEVYWSQRSVIRNGSVYTVGVLQEKTSTVNKNRCRVSFINRYNSTDQEDTVAIYHNNELIGIGVDELNITDDNIAVSAWDAYNIFKLLIPSGAADTGGSNAIIETNYADFKSAVTRITALRENMTYWFQDGPATLFGGMIVFRTLNWGFPSWNFEVPVCVMGATQQVIQGRWRLKIDGSMDDVYPFEELYYPSKNIRIIKPSTLGDPTYTAWVNFCNDVVVSEKYKNITINDGALFGGNLPVICKDWTFGAAGHQFGADVELYNGWTVALASGVSGIHKFPDGAVVKNGQVGGRGCSAEYVNNIDFGGSTTLNLGDYPVCGHYTVSNLSSSGIDNIILPSNEESDYFKTTIKVELGQPFNIVASGSLGCRMSKVAYIGSSSPSVINPEYSVTVELNADLVQPFIIDYN